jgi:tetratricopeptide (TPR) repeat protein
MGQPDVAMEHYHKAFKIFSKMHLNAFKGIAYQYMAQIFYEKNEFDEALKNYQHAANIFRKTRPVNHPNLVYVEQIINQLVQKK